MTGEQDILFDLRGGTGFVCLNRPYALNALSLPLIKTFDAQLADWALDPAVKAVVVSGEGGRAYCAGGDIRAIYESLQRGDEVGSDLFRHEYMLIRRIAVFPKPYVALADGIAMGGGVGVSVHGSHRVVTERTLMALPETRIGLFPDIGSSYILPRMPGALGLYLGLTGKRIQAADALYAGMADYYVESERLNALMDALAALTWPAVTDKDAARIIVDGAIRPFAGRQGPSPLAEHRTAVDRCFQHDTMEAIVAALESEGSDWAKRTLDSLRVSSPTSLKVTVEQLRRGRDLDLDQGIAMEFRLSQACLARHDFREGIRAVVVDKDNAPAWSPATLEAVTPDLVEAHFAPLGERELRYE